MDQERSSPFLIPVQGGFVAVEISGDPLGVPVFMLHGMPGSRHGPKPRTSVLYRLGVRLFSYDRPGYGASTRRKGRSVADAAADVATIANYFGVGRFSVVGRSGGGPHALACATLLPEQVVRTATLGCVAPPDASGLNWFDGMTDDNTVAYTLAVTGAPLFATQLRQRARALLVDPDSLLSVLRKEMTDSDRILVKGVALRRLMADTFEEGLRAGADGWIDDVAALVRAWGFELDGIKGPVRLWHGAQDNFAPVSHSQWLMDHIPTADIEIQPESAHFASTEALMEILPWLVDWSSDVASVGPVARPM